MTTILELVSGSWSVYRKHASLYWGFAAWLLLPYAALVLLHVSGLEQKYPLLTDLFLLSQLLLLVWICLLLPLLTEQLIKNKKRVSLESLHERVRQVLPSVVLVALLETLVVLGGFVLLVIPGFLFAVWYMFAGLSALLDNTRGVQALSFSRDMVRGRFFEALWLGVAGPVLIALLFSLAVNVFLLLIAGLSGTPLEAVVATPPPLWVDVTIYVGDVLILPLLMIYVTLTYLHFRNAKQALASGEPKKVG